MIVVIQCAAGKRSNAGHLRTREGKQVLFVADPDRAPPVSDYVYARPDDVADTGRTWREELVEYNNNPGSNPLGLLSACSLYANPTYQRLASKLGADRVYILSAGWGLIRGTFLTPDYDITFSNAARSTPYKLRKKGAHFADFRHLPAVSSEEVIFFGGRDYIPLFCTLTKAHPAPGTIFYNSATPPEAPGCNLRRFETSTRTNWHYECANAYLTGALAV